MCFLLVQQRRRFWRWQWRGRRKWVVSFEAMILIHDLLIRFHSNPWSDFDQNETLNQAYLFSLQCLVSVLRYCDHGSENGQRNHKTHIPSVDLQKGFGSMFACDSRIGFDDQRSLLLALLSVSLKGTPAEIWAHLRLLVCRTRIYWILVTVEFWLN